MKKLPKRHIALERVVMLLVELQSLRIRLADGTEHYVLECEPENYKWSIGEGLLKALNAEEIE
jgi:hypothetical protein